MGILATTSVSFRPTMMQMPNLAVIEMKQITVREAAELGNILMSAYFFNSGREAYLLSKGFR